MNHQPYENWIFAESDLSDEQLQELETHLNTCRDCQQIQLDLRAASGLLQTAPMAAPVPGFAGRWQASLPERRALQQRQQTRRLLLVLVGAALILLILLALHILATSTPVQWVVAGFQTTFSLFSTWNRIQDILLGLLGYIPPVVPIALWIVFTGGLSVLTLLWIISLWRISSQGASQK